MMRLVPILAVVAALAGCASNAAWQSIGLKPPTSPPAVAPASDGTPLPPPAPQVSQQSGQGNIAAQLDAHGWKGLEYTTAVPVGQVILLALMLLLSHRREVLRIRQNGKRP